jgi:predicted XRE-type DNA-binding protein
VNAARHWNRISSVNDLLRGRVSRFSIDALVNIATAIGGTVRIEVQAA